MLELYNFFSLFFSMFFRHWNQLFKPSINFFFPSLVIGLPEHKNMPLEDALSLVDRDFQRYMLLVHEKKIPPRRSKNEVSNLLSQVASGSQVSADQLQHVIDVLQKQKQQANGREKEFSKYSGPFC